MRRGHNDFGVARREGEDLRVERVDHPRERNDVEHALTVAQEVDDLVAAEREDRLAAVEHEARRREVFTEVAAQVVDRLARRLQRDARVEEALHDLQLDEVAVRVEPLGAAALRVVQRRAHQMGAGPVVELAVRDPHDTADLRSAEPAVVGVG